MTWVCSNGHEFRYTAPPLYPPFCINTQCNATSFYALGGFECSATAMQILSQARTLTRPGQGRGSSRSDPI